MITAYFAVSLLMMGAFIGAAYESKDYGNAGSWISLGVLALAWPFTIYLIFRSWGELE